MFVPMTFLAAFGCVIYGLLIGQTSPVGGVILLCTGFFCLVVGMVELHLEDKR